VFDSQGLSRVEICGMTQMCRSGTPILLCRSTRTLARANEPTSHSYPPERRLDAAALTRFLDRRTFAVIATTRANGRPHATMSSYVRRGSVFWLPTLAGTVRERNIQRQPWASLVITEGDANEHVVVIIEGPAQMIAPAG
jgi:nitroimidazol reductase NimA-like FMN-containing flavoprotein (pyridoxamine 5'-phosphate oxidase superfamily)